MALRLVGYTIGVGSLALQGRIERLRPGTRPTAHRFNLASQIRLLFHHCPRNTGQLISSGGLLVVGSMVTRCGYPVWSGAVA